jgi:FKBP-type peptidyl-prolyl cis-trans isomerase
MSRRYRCFGLLVAGLVALALAQSATAAGDKLAMTDIKVGKGQKVAKGDLATVLYEGTLSNGKVFDSNTAKDADPFVFVVGNREVIAGWDQGVVGMQPGGQRKLVVPASLAYGAEGKGDIPPNATLTFKITLLDVIKKGEELVYDKTDIVVGKGAVAQKGLTVTVDFTGTLANGKEFDSTYKKKRTFTFKLGGEGVLRAFQKGIIGMRVGGKRKLRLPPGVAFGMMSINNVPPRSVVFYEIVLRAVKSGK